MNHFLLSCSQGSVFGRCSELLGRVFLGMEGSGIPGLESEIPRVYIPCNLLNFVGFRTRSFIDYKGIASNEGGILSQLIRFFYTELILLFPSGKKFLLGKK